MYNDYKMNDYLNLSSFFGGSVKKFKLSFIKEFKSSDVFNF